MHNLSALVRRGSLQTTLGPNLRRHSRAPKRHVHPEEVVVADEQLRRVQRPSKSTAEWDAVRFSKDGVEHRGPRGGPARRPAPEQIVGPRHVKVIE
eukprot:1230983-Prymnesium_polylepis.1